MSSKFHTVIDYMDDKKNYKNVIEQFPNLPKKFIVIGLPCKLQCLLGGTNIISEIPMGFTYTWVERSPYRGNLVFSGNGKPIKNIEDIHFCMIGRDNELWHENKIIKYPDDKHNDKILIVLSGMIYSGTTFLEKKIFIDRNANIIVTEENEGFSYDDCFVLIEKSRVREDKYEMEMVALSTCANFTTTEYGRIRVIHSRAISPPEINLCQQSFFDSYLKSVSIKCLGGEVMVPLYLKDLFGAHSPIFHVDGFATDKNDYHEINARSFELLIKWLLFLMVKKEFPSPDVMLANEMDLDQWLHISTYFDVPCFVSYFTDVKKCLL